MANMKKFFGNDEGTHRMFARMTEDMPLRSLVMMSGGTLTMEQVEGLLKALNG
jgi:hypothetical protein